MRLVQGQMGSVVANHVARKAMAKGGDVATRAFEAMMAMRKIDIAQIEAAVRGESNLNLTRITQKITVETIVMSGGAGMTNTHRSLRRRSAVTEQSRRQSASRRSVVMKHRSR